MLKKILAATALTAMTAGAAHAGGPMGGMNSPIGELPHARPGQCFARIVTPARYEKVPEVVTVQEGYETLHALEPEFQDASVEFMSKEAGVKYVVRQPKYETRTEKVMVKPGFERLQIVPAQYQNVTETITIGEKRYVWKLGANHSNTRRVDAKTGQVYCLVEIPAETTTVTKRVLIQPEQVKRVRVDAKYIDVAKEVLVDRGGVDEIPVPAEFRTIPTQELVVPARTEKRAHAAKTATIERTVLRAPEKYEWVEVLCDTNADVASISAVQKALADRGYYKGPIDGIIGPMTQRALEDFQSAAGLPHQGYVTIDTLRALGLAAGGQPSRHPKAPRPPQKAPVTHGAEQKRPYDVPASTPVQPMYEPEPMQNDVMMQPEVVPESMEGKIEYISPQEAREGEAVDPRRPYDRPREYSVRKRLNWDGK